MNRRYHHHHRDHGPGRNQGHCLKGVLGRVIHGLGNAFGVGNGAIIATFVVGLIFAPLLTTLVFLAALYWVSYPEQAARQARQLGDWIRSAARYLSEIVFPGPRAETAEPPFVKPQATASANAMPPDNEPPKPHQARSADDLRRRFEALDQRAKSIESFVASDEYRLEREFRQINDEPT